MSLRNCLAKAGDFLSDAERLAITDAAKSYRKRGMEAEDAARAAVTDLLNQAKADIKAAREGGATPTGLPDQEQSTDYAMAQKIAIEHPDLMVTLPGTQDAIPVAEALERIAAEHQDEAQWADLLKVAAECALGG